jgi:putative Mg2+ transporter-C (MgtC) family protein
MDFNQTQIIFQLLAAIILGGLLGLEREYKRKEAGLQTYSLVCLGSCIFTIISTEISKIYTDFLNQSIISLDPSRIILAIATGIGFIGAGVIIHRHEHIEGVTTAAGLWATAAIGTAIGFKFYFTAIVASILIIFIFIVFGILERTIFKNNYK